MSVGSFLREVSALENIERYSTSIMLNQTNVASHTCFVAHIALMLAFREEELGNQINIEKLLLKCQYHDIMEIKTGDILSYVKRSSKELKEQIQKTEKMFFEQFKKHIPINQQKRIEKLIFEAKDNTIEGQILDCADTIDVLRESLIEVSLGNKEAFIPIINASIYTLSKTNLSSVKEFLTENLEDFGIKKTILDPKILVILDKLKQEDQSQNLTK